MTGFVQPLRAAIFRRGRPQSLFKIAHIGPEGNVVLALGNARIGFLNGGTFPRRPRCFNALTCTGRLMQNAIAILPTAEGVSPEHAGDDLAPTGFESDPHSKRIVLDLAEWYGRLARLAELREGGQ
jgi:hypothetical protein